MIIFAQSKIGPSGHVLAKLPTRRRMSAMLFFLPVSKGTNDSSCKLWIGAYEQSNEVAGEITYIPPERLFDRDNCLARSQQNHFLLPMKQFHADHLFTSLNRHLWEQGYTVQFSFEICCRWKQVTSRAHISLRARYRQCSPMRKVLIIIKLFTILSIIWYISNVLYAFLCLQCVFP